MPGLDERDYEKTTCLSAIWLLWQEESSLLDAMNYEGVTVVVLQEVKRSKGTVICRS